MLHNLLGRNNQVQTVYQKDIDKKIVCETTIHVPEKRIHVTEVQQNTQITQQPPFSQERIA
jgi:hypothetical protein